MVDTDYPIPYVEDSEERLVLFLTHDTIYVGLPHFALSLTLANHSGSRPRCERARGRFGWWYVNLESPFVRT
jgi:hypothetical protein